METTDLTKLMDNSDSDYTVPYYTTGGGTVGTFLQFLHQVPPYKYHEPEILKDLSDYIDSTYAKHYAKGDDGLQINDLIMSIGHGEGAFISNAIEYICRYGKKEGNNVVDLYKAIHNIILLVHLMHFKNNKTMG